MYSIYGGISAYKWTHAVETRVVQRSTVVCYSVISAVGNNQAGKGGLGNVIILLRF